VQWDRLDLLESCMSHEDDSVLSFHTTMRIQPIDGNLLENNVPPG
jgi:hypothetical protein